MGEGPVPEIAEMRDPYYRDVFKYLQGSLQMKDYLGEPSKASAKLIGPTFTFEACQKYEGDEKSACEKSAVYQYTADYYKGDPEDGYVSHVFTDGLSREDLIVERDELERSVRHELAIPFNPGAPSTAYEHSMGQTSLPPRMLKTTKADPVSANG